MTRGIDELLYGDKQVDEPHVRRRLSVQELDEETENELRKYEQGEPEEAPVVESSNNDGSEGASEEDIAQYSKENNNTPGNSLAEKLQGVQAITKNNGESEPADTASTEASVEKPAEEVGAASGSAEEVEETVKNKRSGGVGHPTRREPKIDTSKKRNPYTSGPGAAAAQKNIDADIAKAAANTEKEEGEVVVDLRGESGPGSDTSEDAEEQKNTPLEAQAATSEAVDSRVDTSISLEGVVTETDEAEKEDATTEESKENVVQVKMMITQADRAALRGLGYSDEEDIKYMKPEEAQRIIESGEKKEVLESTEESETPDEVEAPPASPETDIINKSDSAESEEMVVNETPPSKTKEGNDSLSEAFQLARERYKGYRAELDEAEERYHSAVTEYQEARSGTNKWQRWTSNALAQKKEEVAMSQQAYDELLEQTREKREERMYIFQSVLERRGKNRKEKNEGDGNTEEQSEAAALSGETLKEQKEKENKVYEKRLGEYASLHEAILERQVDQNVLFIERIKLNVNENNESRHKIVRQTKAAWNWYRKLSPAKKIAYGAGIAGGAGLVAGGLGLVTGGALGVAAGWSARRAIGGTVGMGAAIGVKHGFDSRAERIEKEQLEGEHEAFRDKTLAKSTKDRLQVRKGTRVRKGVSTGLAAGAAVAAGASASSVADQLIDGASIAEVNPTQGIKNIANRAKIVGDGIKNVTEDVIGGEKTGVETKIVTPAMEKQGVVLEETTTPETTQAKVEKTDLEPGYREGNPNDYTVDENGNHIRTGTEITSTPETTEMHDTMYDMLKGYFGDEPKHHNEVPPEAQKVLPLADDESLPEENTAESLLDTTDAVEPVPNLEQVEALAQSETLSLKGTYEAGSSVQRELQRFLEREYADLNKAERGKVAHLLQLELAQDPAAAEAFGVQEKKWGQVNRGDTYEYELDRNQVESVIEKVQRGGPAVEQAEVEVEKTPEHHGALWNAAEDYVAESTIFDDLTPAQTTYAVQALQADLAAMGVDPSFDVPEEKLLKIHELALKEVEKGAVSTEYVPQPEADVTTPEDARGPRAGDFPYRTFTADLQNASEMLGPDYLGETSRPALDKLFKQEGMFDAFMQGQEKVLKSHWGPVSHVPLRSLVADAEPGFTYNIDGTELQLSDETERLLRSMLNQLERNIDKQGLEIDAAQIIENGREFDLTVGDIVQQLSARYEAALAEANSVAGVEQTPTETESTAATLEAPTLGYSESQYDMSVAPPTLSKGQSWDEFTWQRDVEWPERAKLRAGEIADQMGIERKTTVRDVVKNGKEMVEESTPFKYRTVRHIPVEIEGQKVPVEYLTEGEQKMLRLYKGDSVAPKSEVPSKEVEPSSATEVEQEKQATVPQEEKEAVPEKRPTGEQRANAFEGGVTGATEVPVEAAAIGQQQQAAANVPEDVEDPRKRGKTRVNAARATAAVSGRTPALKGSIGGGLRFDVEYSGTGDVTHRELPTRIKQSDLAAARNKVDKVYFEGGWVTEKLRGTYHPEWREYEGTAGQLLEEDPAFRKVVEGQVRQAGRWEQRNTRRDGPTRYQLTEADLKMTPEELLDKVHAANAALEKTSGMPNRDLQRNRATGWRRSGSGSLFKKDFWRK